VVFVSLGERFQLACSEFETGGAQPASFITRISCRGLFDTTILKAEDLPMGFKQAKMTARVCNGFRTS
jgi:hypothetical protein